MREEAEERGKAGAGAKEEGKAEGEDLARAMAELWPAAEYTGMVEVCT